MREQLIKYVDLLFAGAPDATEIKQEILQNTLDRYDDLIAQGKSPQSAYQQAISGIGDINEILSGEIPHAQHTPQTVIPVEITEKPFKWVKGLAIALFILCPIPVLLLENALGICLCLACVAAGVALLTAFGKDNAKESKQEEKRSALNKTINNCIWSIGFAGYFLLSFSTGAWHITWLLFPIMGCSCGIVDAIFDLKRFTLNSVVRLIIYSLLIIVLITSVLGITFSFSSLTDGFLSGDIDGTPGSSGTVSAAEIQDIDIEWVSGSIIILPGETDTISFHETLDSANGKQMVWKQSGDKLIIQFNQGDLDSVIHFGITETINKDLVITVPQNWLGDELTIESVSAAIQVNNLIWEEIDLNTVSGEGTLSNCNVNELTLETVSGHLKYNGTLNTLDCESVSADCEITAQNHPKRINMEGVSCDLILYLPEDCGFTASTESMSGGFSSDFATASKNGNYIFGDGSCQIEAESMSGNIAIRKAS